VITPGGRDVAGDRHPPQSPWVLNYVGSRVDKEAHVVSPQKGGTCMVSPTIPHILLVEDNPGDVRLITESLDLSEWEARLSVVQDGATALAFLAQEGEYADAPRPNLILLDLNLPRVDGREVLRRVKSDPDLAAIPMVVFTSSRAPEDVQAAYAAHGNCYVQKPLHLDGLSTALESIRDFWLNTTILPFAP